MNKRLLVMEDHTLPNVSSSEVAEDLIQMNESNTEIENCMDEIHAAMESAIRLESFSDRLLDMIVERDGGGSLSNTELLMLDLTLDEVYNHGGIDRPEGLSMEAFGQTQKTLADHVQTIKTHAAQILQAIIAAMKKALEYMGDFVHRCVSTAGRMAMYARRLEIQTRQLKDTRKYETYKDAYIAKKLYTRNGDLNQGLQEVMNLVFSSVHVMNGPIVSEIDYLLKRFNRADDSSIADLSVVLRDNYHSAFKYYGNSLPYPQKYIEVPDDCEVWETPVLLGGAVGVGIIPKSNSSLHHFDFKIIDTELLSDETKDLEEVEVSRLNEIRSLLRGVNAIAAGVQVFNQEQRKHEHLMKDLEHLHSSIRNVTGDLSQTDKDILKAVSKIAPKIVSGLHRATFAYALRICKVVINHCEKSMQAYESK